MIKSLQEMWHNFDISLGLRQKLDTWFTAWISKNLTNSSSWGFDHNNMKWKESFDPT